MANSWSAGNDQAIIDATFTDAESFHGVEGAYGINAAGAALTKTSPAVPVKSIKWIGMTNTHTATIVDRNGKILWTHTATSTDPVSELIEDWWRNGWRVSVLGSGTLYINFDSAKA